MLKLSFQRTVSPSHLHFNIKPADVYEPIIAIESRLAIRQLLARHLSHAQIKYDIWDAGFDVTAFYELLRILDSNPIIPLRDPDHAPIDLSRDTDGTPRFNELYRSRTGVERFFSYIRANGMKHDAYRRDHLWAIHGLVQGLRRHAMAWVKDRYGSESDHFTPERVYGIICERLGELDRSAESMEMSY